MREQASPGDAAADEPTVLDDEVLALDIAELAQPLPQGIDRGIMIRAGEARTEPTDPGHVRRRLRLGGKWRHEEG
jgi:hypothetical protein